MNTLTDVINGLTERVQNDRPLDWLWSMLEAQNKFNDENLMTKDEMKKFNH